MKFYSYLKEQKSFATEDDFMRWINKFPKSGRAPKGKKKEFGHLKFLIHQGESYKKYGLLSWDNIENTLSWVSKEELEALFLKDRVEEIKLGPVTYLNTSPLAEKTFMKKAKAIDKLLKSFKGYHKKAIKKPFKVVFKASTQMKPRAKYVEQSDEIWVRHNAKVDNELYGHLLYIIVHELGHRYEKFYGLPKGWKETYTTNYSRKDVSFSSSSETFAELFAISHWPNNYKEYKENINWFKGIMK